MIHLVYHEAYLERYPTSRVESPVRIKAILNRLNGRYPVVTPQEATKDDVLLVHDSEHMIKVELEGRKVLRAAMWAAGGAITAARLASRDHLAFGLIRPPGHHAGRSRFGGFCFFNNMAVAVTHLFRSARVARVSIVDFDMHRADGTSDIFRGDERVCLVDVWAGHRENFMEVLLSRLAALPHCDVLAISAGFDLHEKDWGGLLTTADYHAIGLRIRETAQDKAEGRCFALLEGGYAVNALGQVVMAFCLGLEGLSLDAMGG